MMFSMVASVSVPIWVLVAEVGDVIVALGSYYPDSDAVKAEVGIVVDDAYQRRGIGLALSACLCRDALCAGVQQLQGEVEGSNRGVLRLFRRLNLPMTVTWAEGGMQVEITLEPGSAQPALALQDNEHEGSGEHYRVRGRKTA